MVCKQCGAEAGARVVRNLCEDCASKEFRALMECAALRKTRALAAQAYRQGRVSARFALAVRQALQHLERVSIGQ
jgi:hypothetical protein